MHTIISDTTKFSSQELIITLSPTTGWVFIKFNKSVLKGKVILETAYPVHVSLKAYTNNIG